MSIDECVDHLDAAIYTGDGLGDEEALVNLEFHLERWARAAKEAREELESRGD